MCHPHLLLEFFRFSFFLHFESSFSFLYCSVIRTLKLYTCFSWTSGYDNFYKTTRCFFLLIFLPVTLEKIFHLKQETKISKTVRRYHVEASKPLILCWQWTKGWMFFLSFFPFPFSFFLFLFVRGWACMYGPYEYLSTVTESLFFLNLGIKQIWLMNELYTNCLYKVKRLQKQCSVDNIKQMG